jgi:glutamate racemase
LFFRANPNQFVTVAQAEAVNRALPMIYNALTTGAMSANDAASQYDDNAPLLFFDSGIGGLSVLKAVQTALPNAPIVYAADYAAMPYGDKSEAEIAARVPALLGRLVERFRPRLVVIACNTACTIALAHVRAALDLPIIGTVPAVKPAALATRSGVFGLLGTAATVRQGYVDRMEAEFAADKLLLRYAAPELVLAAEAKMRGEANDPQIFVNAMRGLTEQKRGDEIDIVILGCTHFPLLVDELAKAAPADIQFVDGSAGIARRIVHLTAGQSWPSSAQSGIFVTTGPLDAITAYLAELQQLGFSDFATL